MVCLLIVVLLQEYDVAGADEHGQGEQAGEQSDAQGPPGMGLGCRYKDGELAPEGVKGRHAADAEGADEEAHREHRAVLFGAQLAHVRGAAGIEQSACAQEEHGFVEGVIEEMENGAIEPQVGAQAQSQDDVTHLAHAAIGEHPFQIGLIERRDDAHQHGDGAQNNAESAQGALAGENDGGEARDGIDGDLDGHAGKQRADRAGRLGVRIRQPGMKGNKTGLAAKPDDH